MPRAHQDLPQAAQTYGGDRLSYIGHCELIKAIAEVPTPQQAIGPWASWGGRLWRPATTVGE